MAIKPERVWRFALPYDERKPDLRLCTENQRIAADTHSVEYIRADIHRAVVSERDAARAEVERLRDVLRHYQSQMCEGFCANLPQLSTYTRDMDNECAGCKARAALTTKGGA
jgi:hypothetical protein